MSWDACLYDDRGHCEGDWNYTHNTSGMIRACLDDADSEALEALRAEQGYGSWYDLLSGRSGPDGAAFLHGIIGRLSADPDRFRAMNPPNGWGDYDSLVKTLESMRDAVPEWPTEWSVSG